MKIILLALASLLSNPLYSAQLGSITAFNEKNNEFEIQTSDGAHTKIIFYRSNIFRIWLGPGGNFTDPAGTEETPIVIYNGEPIKVNHSEENDYYKLETDSCVLRIYKNPCTFSLFKKDNSTLLFEESVPITYEDESYQSINKNTDDYFYGGGMQNGHFCHNDQVIQIENIYDDEQNIWNEQEHPMRFRFI